MDILDEETKKIFVDGIRQGNIDSLEERVQMKASLLASAGYTLVRGNHIDTEIGKKLGDSKKGSYKVCYYENGWDFLRFEITMPDGNKIWIVTKPNTYMDKGEKLDRIKEKYQNKLSKWANTINKKHHCNSEEINLFNDTVEGDNLPENEIPKNVVGFYFMGYSVSKSNRDISSIGLYDVYDGETKLVDDLSSLNAASDIKVSDDLRSKLDDTVLDNPEEDNHNDEYSYYNDAKVKHDHGNTNQ